MIPLIEILRPHQWYKNLLIFMPIIFSTNLRNVELYPIVLTGFVLLCCISSVNYIINDLRDIEADKKHPEKRNRPLPSGRISKRQALIYAIFLFIISISVSFYLNALFGASVLALFLTVLIYTLYLKNIVFIDVITISADFVIRAVAGGFIISLMISPWLILCAFLLALFLALCKRKGDLEKLGGENAAEHKEIFRYYTPELLTITITSASSMLILSYAMYCFLASESNLMMITIPIAIFLIFRYLYLVYSHSSVARSPEKVFLDKQMIIGMIIWLGMILTILYA